MSFWKLVIAVCLGNIIAWCFIAVLGFLFWVAGVSLFVGEIEKFNSSTSFSSPSRSVIQSPSQNSLPLPKVLPKNYQKNISKFVERSLSHHETPKPRERVFSDNAIRKNKQTCDFWTRQYRKDGDPESLEYRQSSCSRYKYSLRAYK